MQGVGCRAYSLVAEFRSPKESVHFQFYRGLQYPQKVRSVLIQLLRNRTGSRSRGSPVQSCPPAGVGSEGGGTSETTGGFVPFLGGGRGSQKKDFVAFI